MKMKKLAAPIIAAFVVLTVAAPVTEAVAAPQKKKVQRTSQVKVVKHAKKPSRTNPLARKARVMTYEDVSDANARFLRSTAVLVQDQMSGDILFEKNAASVVPIASITKLMTAIVVLDAEQDLRETLSVSDEDIDTIRGSRSRLHVGAELSREEMLRLALMSSENRAASALSRHYPSGEHGFVAAMNRKAQALGLGDTRFRDPTGLNAGNVSSARDLVKLVAAASHYPLIREMSTTPEYTVELGGRPKSFHNTNALVSNPSWEIGVSKTGFINESGKCLVMQVWLNSKPTIIVLLDSSGRLTRIGDAMRIKKWVENPSLQLAHSS